MRGIEGDRLGAFNSKRAIRHRLGWTGVAAPEKDQPQRERGNQQQQANRASPAAGLRHPRSLGQCDSAGPLLAA